MNSLRSVIQNVYAIHFLLFLLPVQNIGLTVGVTEEGMLTPPRLVFPGGRVCPALNYILYDIYEIHHYSFHP